MISRMPMMPPGTTQITSLPGVHCFVSAPGGGETGLQKVDRLDQ